MKRIALFVFALMLVLSSCEKKKEKKFKAVKIPAGVSATFARKLPHPFFAEKQYLAELYWKTWSLLEKHVKQGTPQNGFVARYLDEGFNENIYQWDTCFMTTFAMYGEGLFPAMESLDNFYGKQHEDGWMCRVYRESDGEPAALPTAEEPMINPTINGSNRIAAAKAPLAVFFIIPRWEAAWIIRRARELKKAAGLISLPR